jgi:hypothetical protein
LSEAASEPHQRVGLPFVFDPFRDDVDFVGSRELREQFYDWLAAESPAWSVDERTVDFERIDRKFLQIPKRRVSRAEVVDAQSDSQAP